MQGVSRNSKWFSDDVKSHYIRELSKRIISEEWPEEEAYFETVWKVMSSLTQQWLGLGSEEWFLKEKGRVTLDKLALVGQTRELISPVVIGVVSACLSHVFQTNLEDPARQIAETIDKYTEKFELKGRPKKVLLESLPTLLKELVVSVDEEKRPWIAPSEREYSAEEVLAPDFEFKDKLELGWENGTPYCKINGEEIRVFRSQERSFCVLLCMAAVVRSATSNNEAWKVRSEFLDQKGQEIGKLRNFLNGVNFKRIPADLRKEIIKSHGGKIKLTFARYNIAVNGNIVQFESRHTNILEKKLAEAKIELNSYKCDVRSLSKLHASVKHNSGRYERNTMLVLEACTILKLGMKGERFKEITQKVDIISAALMAKINELRSKG